MRTRVLFSNEQSTSNGESQDNVNQPPRKKSNWKPPKCNIPEVETFLNLEERDIFSNTNAIMKMK